MGLIYKRMTAFIVIVVIMFGVLLLRLGYVQVTKGEAYIERAYELWTRNIPVSTRRGRIFDCNGKLIVGNTIAPTVSIIPNQVTDKEKTINILATLLKVDASSIKDHFYKNVSVEIIKPEGKNIDIEIAKKIIAADLPGVYVSGDVVRYYPYGNALSHVLGIVGIDNQGITGIEYIYNDYLAGNLGSQNIFTDAHGNKIEGFTGDYTNPEGGLDLYLTINIDIQITLERLLDNATANYDSNETFGIVMDPNSSEILAMASRPNFELNNYQDYSQEDYNRNLPIWYSFEPGSTFKIVTYSAGLEEGVFSPAESFYDPGYVIVDGARIRDWKAGGHGEQTFLEVIQNSCNPGFVEIGRRLGKERLFEYIKNFGFGTKTGIDLLGEGTGILFNPNRIGNVELATSSFGQGNSVTAIQLVNAASAAVNGGYLHKPHVLKGFGINNTQVFQYSSQLIRQVISEKTSEIVKDALERVVSLGLATTLCIY